MIRRLLAQSRGASAVEFALTAPVMILLLVGIAQIGIALAAGAGLRQAVAEGARYAALYPAPTDAQIIARVQQKRFFLNPERLTGPTLTRGVYNGVNYVDIHVAYSVQIVPAFAPRLAIPLSETRRAYLP